MHHEEGTQLHTVVVAVGMDVVDVVVAVVVVVGVREQTQAVNIR